MTPDARKRALALLEERREGHDALLKGAVAVLEADDRVAGAWVFGSRGRDDADALSDVDLVVVVHDEHLETLKGERRELVSRLGPPLLIQDLPRNAPPGGSYLLVLYPGETGPLHMDWYWRGLSGAEVPHDARLALERPEGVIPRRAPPAAPTEHERAVQTARDVIFFWAMAPIAAKYIARRKALETFDMLRMVTNALGRVRRAVDQAGSGAAHRTEERLAALLTADGTQQLAELRRLCEEMRALLPRIGPLERDAGRLEPGAPEQISRLIDFTEMLISDG